MSDVVVEGTALAVPSEDDLKNFSKLSVDKQQEIKSQIEAMTSVTAAAVLSNKGWDVLKQLYVDASQELLLTAGFVIPVRQQFNAILAKVTDKIGFEENFETLQRDLLTHRNNLSALWQQHNEKTGQPTSEELVMVNQLAGFYSEAVSLYAELVAPRLNALINVVREEYSPTLVIQTEATTDATE